jgi:hypothetical protein
MAYKLKLTKGLSYNGIVYADHRNPIVKVKSKKEADEVIATGYFELVEEKREDLNNQTEDPAKE